MTTRRTLIKQGALGAATLATASTMPWRMLRAQPKPIKIAVIAPLSGPWARQGTLVKWGAETAIDEINAAGGIKAMGGAKLELVAIDAGDSAEKAKNAAQRLVAQEPDVVGGMGAWLSHLHARRDRSHRARADSLAHALLRRQHHGARLQIRVPELDAGRRCSRAPRCRRSSSSPRRRPARRRQTAGIIGDNTASPVAFLKPMREGGLQKLGIKTVMDETYTPPLSDATPLIQKVRSTRPEFLVFISTTISDVKLGLEKLNEFRLAKGVIPVIANGAHMGAPEVLKNVPADLIEGLMFIVANWQLKGQDKISDLFKKHSGEPWITQDGLAGYGHTWILKEALERAGVADRIKVNDEIQQARPQDRPGRRHVPGRREVRRGRPPRRRAGVYRAVAGRQAGDGLSRPTAPWRRRAGRSRRRAVSRTRCSAQRCTAGAGPGQRANQLQGSNRVRSASRALRAAMRPGQTDRSNGNHRIHRLRRHGGADRRAADRCRLHGARCSIRARKRWRRWSRAAASRRPRRKRPRPAPRSRSPASPRPRSAARLRSARMA